MLESNADATFCHSASSARDHLAATEASRAVEQAQALANCASHSACKAALSCLDVALSVLNRTDKSPVP